MPDDFNDDWRPNTHAGFVCGQYWVDAEFNEVYDLDTQIAQPYLKYDWETNTVVELDESDPIAVFMRSFDEAYPEHKLNLPDKYRLPPGHPVRDAPDRADEAGRSRSEEPYDPYVRDLQITTEIQKIDTLVTDLQGNMVVPVSR